MSDSGTILLCLVGIFAAIGLNIKTKMNTGLFAIAFAYLIGCFGMGMSVSSLIEHFSVKILFLLLSVCVFYGYAVENGTLMALASRMIYRFRNRAKLLPFVLFLVCFLLAALGASPPAVASFMAPICYAIAAQTGIHVLIMTVLITTGAGAGACVPWSSAGAVICGVVNETQYAPEAFGLALKICANFFLAALATLILLYIAFKGYRAKAFSLERPEKLNTVQKKNLAVIGVALAWLLIPAMIQALAPNEVTAFLTKYCDTQMVSIFGAIVCGLMRLGDERKILQHAVPWTTILAVCGISMLLGVATEAGAVEMVSQVLSSNLSPAVIVAIFLLVGGFMSFFTGGVTVVTPMLLPIALLIATERNMNLTLVCSAAVLGALATGMSPFSTGGSLVVAGMPDEQEREKLVNRQFAVTFVAWGVFLLFGVTGIFGLLN